MITTAVILAAGLGTRFSSKTEIMPKGFIEVGGKSMIIRAIETLISCGIQRIIIGTGHKKEMYDALLDKYPQIICCFSKHYATTNSMWTLWNCRKDIGNDDFILLESDLIFEEKAISSLLKSSQPDIMLCADVTKFQDSYFIEIDHNNYLINCSINRNELHPCGELVGIHKISSSFFRKICTYYSIINNEKPKMGYEFALLHISKTSLPLYVLKINDLQWYEIDDQADLNFAERKYFRNF